MAVGNYWEILLFLSYEYRKYLPTLHRHLRNLQLLMPRAAWDFLCPIIDLINTETEISCFAFDWQRIIFSVLKLSYSLQKTELVKNQKCLIFLAGGGVGWGGAH